MCGTLAADGPCVTSPQWDPKKRLASSQENSTCCRLRPLCPCGGPGSPLPLSKASFGAHPASRTPHRSLDTVVQVCGDLQELGARNSAQWPRFVSLQEATLPRGGWALLRLSLFVGEPGTSEVGCRPLGGWNQRSDPGLGVLSTVAELSAVTAQLGEAGVPSALSPRVRVAPSGCPHGVC